MQTKYISTMLSVLVPITLCAADFSLASHTPASYRKDQYLPYDQYAEANLKDPSTGGRITAVLSATGAGVAEVLRINGTVVNTTNSSSDPSTWDVDWFTILPLRALQAGDQVLVTLHSSRSVWDTVARLGSLTSVEVQTTTGTTLASSQIRILAPQDPHTAVSIDYVTTRNEGGEILIYASLGTAPNSTVASYSQLQSLHLNGVDVLSQVPAASRTLAPGQQTLWLIKLASPL